HSHGSKVELRIRNVVFRTVFHIQPAAFYVPYNAHDFSRLRLTMVGRSRRDVLPYHIFIGEETLSESLVHNHNARSLVIVPLREIPAGNHGYAQSMEVIWGYDLDISGRLV